jgi:hypothetical protein
LVFFLTAALFLPVLGFPAQTALKRSSTIDSSPKDSFDTCGQSAGKKLKTARPGGKPEKTSNPADFKNWPPRLRGEKGTAIFFLGSLCPCTDAHKHSIMELMSLAPKKGVKLTAVFPNRGESEELIEHFFKGIGFEMDYILDPTNRWVRKFDAKKTPQVFLVDSKGRTVYSGPIDDSVENLGQVKNAFLKNAVLELAEGKPVSLPRAEGSGCWIVPNR